jgi:hypothetical protein
MENKIQNIINKYEALLKTERETNAQLYADILFIKNDNTNPIFNNEIQRLININEQYKRENEKLLCKYEILKQNYEQEQAIRNNEILKNQNILNREQEREKAIQKTREIIKRKTSFNYYKAINNRLHHNDENNEYELTPLFKKE